MFSLKVVSHGSSIDILNCGIAKVIIDPSADLIINKLVSNNTIAIHNDLPDSLRILAQYIQLHLYSIYNLRIKKCTASNQF